jgi:hypothetical protein
MMIRHQNLVVGSSRWRHPILIVLPAAAAFITYLSMYAFRKPFTAATFDGLYLWGIPYKIVLILSQLIGYTISKYLGIKFIAELPAAGRINFLIGLMAFALLTLFLFGIVGFPYNWILMLLNGLPLGMIWGVVFSFLEGRRTTELLGAVMASSFILSSGLVKSAGSWLLISGHIAENWMPFLTALFFLPVLIIGIFLLKNIHPPDEEDMRCRTERLPMNFTDRQYFYKTFAPGIVLSVLLYVALTIFRDLRDNFAVEFWNSIGLDHIPSLLTFSELPTAFLVLIVIASMIAIRNNRRAFYGSLLIAALSGFFLVLITWLFNLEIMSGLIWMILSGALMYMPYIAYHTLYFERWIAYFRFKGNAGFLMYTADAAGYLGSTIILIFKSFASPDVSWVMFLKNAATYAGLSILVLSILAIVYFRKIEIHPALFKLNDNDQKI